MGVPAFFRWLMLKYPKSIVSAIPINTDEPNPNGMEFDNLYLDMNGIVHNCSHGEDLGRRPETEAEMFENICKYIDRLLAVARPRKLLYMAVDGVAPRAKMNQQRSRRFRAAQERDEVLRKNGMQVPPKKKPSWDHNVITPGTVFMTKLSEHLRWYCHDRLTNNPNWKHLKIVLSDARCPGEGEHKIMQYIRQQRAQPGYNPNEKHILHGLDADLIMLGLATHEANFTIFREQVFTPKGKEGEKFLHISILREYLPKGQIPFVYNFERIVDDFVFLCFFVGNDFLPHLPSLDIREGALGVLMNIYRAKLPAIGGYLTNCGDVNLSRVDVILAVIGEFEEETYLRRNQEADKLARQCTRGKRCRFKHGNPEEIAKMKSTNPLCKRCHYKHNDDRDKIDAIPLGRKSTSTTKMNQNPNPNNTSAAALKATLSKKNKSSSSDVINEIKDTPSSSSLSSSKKTVSVEEYQKELKELIYDNNVDDTIKDDVKFGISGWKGRYYLSKFVEHFTKGLCWVLAYYYKGCVSWKWYYPYHYAPCASDLLNLDQFKIKFELSEPFTPIAQLMGVQPESSKHMLPKPSPIIDFYPKEFQLDANGHKYKWLWVVLLPFIDEKRLFDAMKDVIQEFSPAEKLRNTRGHDLLYVRYDHPLASAVLAATKDSLSEHSQKVYVQRCDGASINGVVNIAPHMPGQGDIQSNQAFVLHFDQPPEPDCFRPHRCEILEGAILPDEVLLPQDKFIKEPRLGRGVSIADLGKSVLEGTRPRLSNNSGGQQYFSQNRNNNNSQMYRPPRSWGSAAPRQVRKRRRVDEHYVRFIFFLNKKIDFFFVRNVLPNIFY
eukprot:GSMAST32.ASY1.ANO1.713.1 assembled CDS